MIDFWTYVRNFKWGWVDAVKEAEATDDLTSLARVLRSDSPIDSSTRDLLANLCDRRRLVRKRGRPLEPLRVQRAVQGRRRCWRAVRPGCGLPDVLMALTKCERWPLEQALDFARAPSRGGRPKAKAS